MAEDMFPKPSVGRMVHYKEESHCVAAIVTWASDDGLTVGATLFPPSMLPVVKDAMVKGDGNGEWHWPGRV